MDTILLVEDDREMQKMWKDIFGSLLNGNRSSVELLDALTITEAERHFFAGHGITLVAMDACVPGSEPNTMPLVRKMRTVFSGPIIAISSTRDYQRLLMAAGCSHKCEKENLPYMIAEILGFKVAV